MRPGVNLPRTDKQKADYTGDLHGAWADCHDTVAATAERKKKYAEQYNKAKQPPIVKFFGGIFKGK